MDIEVLSCGNLEADNSGRLARLLLAPPFVFLVFSFLFFLKWKRQIMFCFLCQHNWCCLDVPRVRLELGRNLESEHIREGIDVYFDCHVTARPSAVRLVWRHQVRSSLPLESYLNECRIGFEFPLVLLLRSSWCTWMGYKKWPLEPSWNAMQFRS